MRSRIVMSMLAGATLLASTLLAAGPAQAAVVKAQVPAAQAQLAASKTQTATAKPQLSDAPAEFGTDWHDPLTAAPPVSRPATKSCQVTLADTEFRDFTPYKGTYTPPKACGDGWSKVVLRLDGTVAGRQYDRLGYLHVGGVEILRTSTPEPSPDGIKWSVEKDVTRYSATFRSTQDVEMLIGNVVDDTYTGVIGVKATLTFYEGRPPAAQTPDRVLTLATDATLTTPRNTERIVAEATPPDPAVAARSSGISRRPTRRRTPARPTRAPTARCRSRSTVNSRESPPRSRTCGPAAGQIPFSGTSFRPRAPST